MSLQATRHLSHHPRVIHCLQMISFEARAVWKAEYVMKRTKRPACYCTGTHPLNARNLSPPPGNPGFSKSLLSQLPLYLNIITVGTRISINYLLNPLQETQPDTHPRSTHTLISYVSPIIDSI